jgi:hypothetical protein
MLVVTNKVRKGILIEVFLLVKSIISKESLREFLKKSGGGIKLF